MIRSFWLQIIAIIILASGVVVALGKSNLHSIWAIAITLLGMALLFINGNFIEIKRGD